MTSRLASLAVDAVDPERTAAFWCAVLGWEVTGRDDEVVRIEPVTRDALPIEVGRVPAPGSPASRLRVEVRADGPAAAEVARLLALGARPAGRAGLVDPDGTAFVLRQG